MLQASVDLQAHIVNGSLRQHFRVLEQPLQRHRATRIPPDQRRKHRERNFLWPGPIYEAGHFRCHRPS